MAWEIYAWKGWLGRFRLLFYRYLLHHGVNFEFVEGMS